MTTSEIIELQKRIGTEPDGAWGPASIRACQKHLKALMPIPNPWPLYRDMEEFYGKPGENHTTINVAGLGVKYGSQEVRKITVNERCAESLLDIFEDIHDSPFASILESFAGCFNNRQVRQGKSLSTHAYAAAVDLKPAGNGNLTPWPVKATMPIEVMEIFSKYGWVSAGAFWGRDAQHFQACLQI